LKKSAVSAKAMGKIATLIDAEIWLTVFAVIAGAQVLADKKRFSPSNKSRSSWD